MNKKLLLSFTGLLTLSMSFVSADIASSPIDLTVPFAALAFVVGLIVGAVFLIRYIIKKLKHLPSEDSSSEVPVDSSFDETSSEKVIDNTEVPLGEEDLDITYDEVKIDSEKGNI